MTQPAANILLVDDEPSITEHLSAFLQRAGYGVRCAADGKAALQEVEKQAPDLMILDVLMPKMDGRAVLRTLRSQGSRLPVILLTQVGEAGERAMALEEGADDYLNKPFDPRELLARARAVLRRAQSSPVPLSSAWKITSAGLVLDRRARRAALNGKVINLTPKALSLLEYLMTHPDELITRERLLDAVWGWDYPAGTRAVDTRIAELRRALGDEAEEPRYIETVTGEGYRYRAAVEGEQ
ncbi:MAG: response regulator transcription factor [Anaerolineales bacterium]|nr:response regulator transcription factor [Anaerolineales bacterium]